jgi:PAS domain-containing protein
MTTRAAAWLALLLAGAGAAVAAVDVEPGSAAAWIGAKQAFDQDISPFVATYCERCHGEKKRKGDFTFVNALKDPLAVTYRPLWKLAVTKIHAQDMPPDTAEKQPSMHERELVAAWVAGLKRVSPKDPGLCVIRRLSKVEYANTLHDLLGVDPQVAKDLPEEVFGAGYSNTISPLLMEQYLLVANEALAQAIAPSGSPPTAAQQRLFVAMPDAHTPKRDAARRIAETVARRAYRRPASAAELEVLLQVFALADAKGAPFTEAIRLMLKAVLVSPQFLFIMPDAPVAAGTKTAALDDHQLAARLSYLLWATMPDDELMRLADAGTLRQPAVLAAQARRLLADPRSRALFDGFGAQWLGIDRLADKTFDETKFPQMTRELRAAMYEEARLLFDTVVREDRSIVELVDCDYTFVNRPLAAIYGLTDADLGGQLPAGKRRQDELHRVQLRDRNRGGILTMPAVLAMTSFPNRTSPVKRGVWVLEQILGESTPPPPPNVPALDRQDPARVAKLTLRQRTELHRTDPVCANCHKILDPIGFGLENFDAIGRWRDRDESGGAVDASGELPGAQRFASPQELKRIIAARRDDFCHTLAAKLLAYALCRQLEGYDELVVDELAAAVAKDGYRMQSLVVAVVTSYPFTNRRLSD